LCRNENLGTEANEVNEGFCFVSFVIFCGNPCAGTGTANNYHPSVSEIYENGDRRDACPAHLVDAHSSLGLHGHGWILRAPA
jgi:hypothetical protein